MKIRILKALTSVLFILSLIMFTACGSALSAYGAPRDTVIYGSRTDINSIDMHLASNVATQSILANIFEPLVVLDAEGDLTNRLITDWSVSGDGLTYLFTLKEGVKFHNGEVMTPSDVLYTFEYAKKGPKTAPYVKPITSIEAVGDDQVRMTLSAPYAPFVRALANIPIYSRKAGEEAGNDYSLNPVGTGPYLYVDRLPGSRVYFKRFADYHGKPGTIENIEIHVINDNTTRALSLEAGDIDMSTLLAATDTAAFEANPDFTVLSGASLMDRNLNFNNERKPFNDPRVRRAMAMAINKEEGNIAAYEGTAYPAMLPITPYTFGYTEKYQFPGYDLEAAKALMAEAGYAEGFTTTLQTQAGELQLLSEYIQAALKKLNVDVEIQVLELGSMGQNVEAGNYDMIIYGYIDQVGDADDGIGRLLSTDTKGLQGNIARYSNAKVDELIVKARTESDPDVRLRLYEEILKIAVDECPFLPLFFDRQTFEFPKNLKGITFHPKLFVDFAALYYE